MEFWNKSLLIIRRGNAGNRGDEISQHSYNFVRISPNCCNPVVIFREMDE
jgi:hypothetical protein